MSEEPLIIKSFNSLTDIIRKFLRNRYKENINEELPEELLRPPIFIGIFPIESRKIERILNEALSNLIRIKNETITNIDKLIIDQTEGRHEEHLIFGSYVTLPSIFVRLYEELLKLLSPSVAAAIILQLQLNRLVNETNYSLRLRRVGEAESETGIVSPLHMAWSLLAGKGFSYLRIKGELKTLINNKEKIRNNFIKILNNNKKFHEIYRAFMEGEQKDLANVLSRWLSRKGNPELYAARVNYFARLIFGVKEALVRAGFKPNEKILRGYMNACVVNYGFFEYELYSLLVNEGIPAIPKLEVHYRVEQEGKEAREREKVRELDILTMDSKGYLTQVEVTTTANLSELQEEIKDGPAPIASRLIVVAPKKALEGIDCWGYNVTCIPLEEPYRLVNVLRST